jgi:hypothetical protein
LFQWKDENIKWNQDESYVTDLTLGWTDVWKPVLRVDNPHADSSNRQATERSYVSILIFFKPFTKPYIKYSLWKSYAALNAPGEHSYVYEYLCLLLLKFIEISEITTDRV